MLDGAHSRANYATVLDEKFAFESENTGLARLIIMSLFFLHAKYFTVIQVTEVGIFGQQIMTK